MPSTTVHNSPNITPDSDTGNIPAGLVWCAFGLLMFAVMLRPVSPQDIWFILLMGSKTLETLAVPQQQFFLYTADGDPELFGTWGFGVLMELARRAMGLYGLVFLNALLWSGAYLFAFMAIRQRLGRDLKLPFSLAEIVGIALVTLLLYEAVLHRSWMRPEVTVFLTWAAGCYLMESARRRGCFRSALIIYPLIVWAEAWLHTAGTVLLVPLLAYGAERIFGLLRTSPPGKRLHTLGRALLPWALSLCAALILPVINPNGLPQVYAQLDMFLQVLTEKKGLISGQEIANPGLPLAESLLYNIEYLPAWKWPPLYRLYCLLISVGICLLLMERRRLVNCLCILPMALFALLHIRGIGLFAWALLIPFGVTLIELTTLVVAHLCQSRPKAVIFATPILVLTLMVAVGGLFVLTTKEQLLARFPLTMPLAQGMAPILANYPDGGNVFTEMHLGAITAWTLGTKYKVSLSAHVIKAPPQLTQHIATVTFVRSGWEEELGRHKVIALLSNINDLVDGRIKPLVLRLAYHHEWTFSASEENVATFIRRQAGAAPLSTAAQLDQLRRYWENVRTGAEAIYAYTPYPNTLRAIKISRYFLRQINRDDLAPDDKLALLLSAAQKLPEWHGDISAKSFDPASLR